MSKNWHTNTNGKYSISIWAHSQNSLMFFCCCFVLRRKKKYRTRLICLSLDRKSTISRNFNQATGFVNFLIWAGNQLILICICLRDFLSPFNTGTVSNEGRHIRNWHAIFYIFVVVVVGCFANWIHNSDVAKQKMKWGWYSMENPFTYSFSSTSNSKCHHISFVCFCEWQCQPIDVNWCR